MSSQDAAQPHVDIKLGACHVRVLGTAAICRTLDYPEIERWLA